VSVRDTDFDPDTWWESRQGRKLFFLETVGYIVAMWEQWRAEPESGTAASPEPSTETPAAR
jgi:hypothetical protein